MLRKLIKHELRATGRVMLPLLAIVLVAAVGGNISTYRLLETQSGVLNTLGVVLLTAFVIAIATACVASFALMVERFYKNLLRDKGYLTMTLPVSVHEHIWAKLLTSLIWWIAVCLVVAAGMLILVFNPSILQEVREILVRLKIADLNLLENLPHLVLFCVELALMLAVGGACVCLHFYMALAVGCSFTHHKEALSVAGFFVLPMVWHAVQELFTNLLHLLPLEGVMLWAQGLPQAAQVHLMMLGVTAVTAIPAALYYAVTAYFLKNRLNLG
ncbi:MAG: hypothetical protein ACI4MM_04635 [Candidatus Ventricola sp.]